MFWLLFPALSAASPSACTGRSEGSEVGPAAAGAGADGPGSSGGAGNALQSGGATSTAWNGAGGSATGGSGISGGAGSPLGGGDVYANVVGVSATGTPAAYAFLVSVESADIDCTQYADWWEVLSEDGALLYRRILNHSHTDANGSTDADAPGNTFTRDGGPIAVAADQTVIVRAHMSNGGYRGAVMRGDVEDGFTIATDLPSDFASGVETEEPQPNGCLY